MKDQDMIYTGQLAYKEVDFTFVFDGKRLRLIPPKDKRDAVNEDWLRTPLSNGAYTLNTPVMEEDYLCGICNETNQKIIFLVRRGDYLTPHGNHLLGGNYVLVTKVIAYILCKYDRKLIDRISFLCPEIDAIYPLQNSFTFSLGADFEAFNETGIVSITTKDFDSTTSEPQKFIVDSRTVSVYFSVWRGINMKVGEPPLSLNSCLMFEFEPTNEFGFILRLWRIAKDFLRYLCYRRNVYLPAVKLAAPCHDGKHEEFAAFHVIGEDREPSAEDIKSGRYIKQGLIAGHEGQILTDIASGELYLRRIPESYDSGRHKDAAKFVMITAAFEWEFHRNYPDGTKKSEATRKAEDDATKQLQELVDNNHGKLKSIYKFLKRLVKSDSLQSEIEQIGKDYSDIMDVFGNHLYSLSKEKLIYSEVGKRLGDQRNHFAHGDLDKDFIDLSLLDLIFLERIIYAMQLRHYHIENSKIQNAINDLFHHHFALQQV